MFDRRVEQVFARESASVVVVAVLTMEVSARVFASYTVSQKCRHEKYTDQRADIKRRVRFPLVPFSEIYTRIFLFRAIACTFIRRLARQNGDNEAYFMHELRVISVIDINFTFAWVLCAILRISPPVSLSLSLFQIIATSPSFSSAETSPLKILKSFGC